MAIEDIKDVIKKYGHEAEDVFLPNFVTKIGDYKILPQEKDGGGSAAGDAMYLFEVRDKKGKKFLFGSYVPAVKEWGLFNPKDESEEVSGTLDEPGNLVKILMDTGGIIKVNEKFYAVSLEEQAAEEFAKEFYKKVTNEPYTKEDLDR